MSSNSHSGTVRTPPRQTGDESPGNAASLAQARVVRGQVGVLRLRQRLHQSLDRGERGVARVARILPEETDLIPQKARRLAGEARNAPSGIALAVGAMAHHAGGG